MSRPLILSVTDSPIDELKLTDPFVRTPHLSTIRSPSQGSCFNPTLQVSETVSILEQEYERYFFFCLAEADH